jgi:arylsulfatase A-like enzyme
VLSSWNRDGWSAIREGHWKLVRRDRSGEASRRELYQLSEDPGETKDVSRVEHDRADALEARLLQHRADSERFRAGFGAAETVAPDDEALERLRALGYLESAEPANPQ